MIKRTLCLLILLTLLGSALAWAQERAPVVVEEDGVLTVTLLDVGTLLLEQTPEENGVLLRFGMPVADFPLKQLRAQTVSWFTTISEGYDTVLIKSGFALEIQVTTQGNDLILTAQRRRSADVLDGDQPDAQRRLDRLDAQILAERKRDIHAQQKLDEVYLRDPGDVQSLIDLARQEDVLGRWAHAVALYRQALELSPDSNAIIQPLGLIAKREASFLRITPKVLDYSSGEQHHGVLWDGHYNLTDELRIYYEHEYKDLDVPVFQDPRGGPPAALGLTRNRTLIGAHYPLAPLGTLRVDLIHAQETGAMLSWSQRTTARHWRFEAALGVPEWRYPEGIAREGRRDGARVYFTNKHYEPYWLIQGHAGVQRYHLDGQRDLARSLEAAFAARRVYHLAEPYVSWGYRLDAEYVDHRLLVGNRPFFNVLEREVHTLDLGLAEDLTDYISVETNLGYGYDRFGENGPVVAAALRYEPIPELTARLLYVYSATAGARGGDQSTQSLDLSMHWRF